MGSKQQKLTKEKKITEKIKDAQIQRGIKLFIEQFEKVKQQGYIKSHRFHDTGIGKTFEDLMGVKENNDLRRDFMDLIELKSQRDYTKSWVTLFTKVPSAPRNANTLIRKKYGYPDRTYPEMKVIHCSIYHTKDSPVKNTSYRMQLKLDDDRLVLQVRNKDTNRIEDPQIYWDLETLREIYEDKCDLIAYVITKAEMEGDEEFFKYDKFILIHGYSFEKFLEAIRTDIIRFDIRIGVYKSGDRIGKTHDHGSGFRINKNKFSKVFDILELKIDD